MLVVAKESVGVYLDDHGEGLEQLQAHAVAVRAAVVLREE
jgi:hypothetical protein